MEQWSGEEHPPSLPQPRDENPDLHLSRQAWIRRNRLRTRAGCFQSTLMTGDIFKTQIVLVVPLNLKQQNTAWEEIATNSNFCGKWHLLHLPMWSLGWRILIWQCDSYARRCARRFIYLFFIFFLNHFFFQIYLTNVIFYEIFPSKLKIAKVTPLYKNGPSRQTTNYRPISILTPISKVFEKLIQVRLTKYFTCTKCFRNILAVTLLTG